MMLFCTAIWILLLLATGAVALARQRYAGHEDDTVHVLDTDKEMVSRQQAQVGMLNRFDRWIWTLAIAVVLLGLLLLANYFHMTWQHGGSDFNW